MDGWEERLATAFATRGVRKLQALAVELGVDESAISRWKRGRSISLENAARLCRALDISMDWLVMGRRDMDLHRAPPGPAASDDDLPEWFLPDMPPDQRAEGIQALRLLLAVAARPGAS